MIRYTGFSRGGDDPATQDVKTVAAAVERTRRMVASRLAVYGRQADTDQLLTDVLSIVWERTAVSGRADEATLGQYANGTAQHMVRQHIATLARRREVFHDDTAHPEIADPIAPDMLDRVSARDEARAIARHVRATVSESTWAKVVARFVSGGPASEISAATTWWVQQVATVVRAAVQLASEEPWLGVAEVQERCVRPRTVGASASAQRRARAERETTLLRLVAWRVFRDERFSW